MSGSASVLEYKCPCCDAALKFSDTAQKLTCDSCGNEFEIEAVREYNTIEENNQNEFTWNDTDHATWTAEEEAGLRHFSCPACGGEILSDDHTAATFCPYCENPAILPGRVSGGWKPDAVLPFKTNQQDAREAFLKLCKGKPLLPREFTSQQRIEKITGMYVPFWLYNCSADQSGTYKATRVRHWSDSKYMYTKTSHYLLKRGARAAFDSIPMDASSKMDNAIMESIEPFDYSQMVDFDTAYLSGFLADKYDVESQAGEQRIRQRVENSMEEMIATSIIGYTTAVPTSKNVNIAQGKAKYVLLPVWILHSKFQDQTYVFAMNGQTGKMTGTFPICPKRSAAWFAGICAAVTALVAALQFLLM